MAALHDTDLTLKAADLARALGFGEVATRVTVVWNPRLRTSAGRALLHRSVIELNRKLLTLENADDETDRTLRHELAHLLVYARYGLRVAAHGAEWRQMCARVGIPGESARHSLPWEVSRRRRPYIYACRACGVEMRRTKKMTRAAACVACCRAHNNGKYSSRYEMQLVRVEGE